MSTKSMHLPPRRNKRKESDDFDVLKPQKLAKPNAPQAGFAKPAADSEPVSGKSNQLLAGYLAHEFLTQGTLFGQPWESSARAEPTRSAEPRRAEPERRRYVEVASLMSLGGAQFPGIVNPTQLARALHM